MHPLLQQQRVRVLVLGPEGPQRLSSLLSEIELVEQRRFYFDFVSQLDDLNEALVAEAPGLALVFRDLGNVHVVSEAIAALRATSGYPPILLYPEESETCWDEYVGLGAADFGVWTQVHLRQISRWFHLAACRSVSFHRKDGDEKRIESQFDAKSHFHAVTESLAEGLTIFTRDGRMEFCNRQFEELTGYTREELKGRRVYEIFFPEDSPERDEYRQLMEKRYYARRRGVNEVYETRIYRKNGERRWIETKAASLRDIDGRIIGSIGANTDITERKHLEEQLRWSQKMEAVGRLAGGVAHDFNNLLTAIYGYSEMILKSLSEDDPLHRKVTIIKRSSEAACTLTRQLLTISRKSVVQRKCLSVNTILSDNEDLLRGLVGDRCELILEEGASEVAIETDTSQLQQVLLNLAINARDAMPEGGTLHISTDVCTLPRGMLTPRSSLQPGTYFRVRVRDTGHGMTREVLSHVFEPFFTTKRGKGTGLGLSTVYAIVKDHKGEILVDSKVGQGTTFEIYIPTAARAVDLEVLPEPDAMAQPGTARILVAEDEDSVRSLVRDVLVQHGYTVSLARDGAEALEMALGTDAKFDLLLTDVIMPKLHGIDLAKELLEQLPTLKVIFMSGYTDDSTIPALVEELQTPFLAKPFDADSLLRLVYSVVHSEPAESAAPKEAKVGARVE